MLLKECMYKEYPDKGDCFMAIMNGLLACQRLNQEQLAAIRQLSEICNDHDQIRLKLNWDSLETRSSEETNDWLFYEDGKLIAFLGLYYFTLSEAELSGMVHPDHRRKGIFRLLVEQAREACMSRGFPQMIFMNQRGSISGKAFLEQYGAVYHLSEYWMELEKSNVSEFSVIPRSDIQLRVATNTSEDIETIVHIHTNGFGIDEEDVRTHLLSVSDNDYITTLIVNYNNVPVGNIRYQSFLGVSFIFGFCMLPEYRGLGFGRYTLLHTIKRIQAEAPDDQIILEVATENERALSLYQSCGFRMDNINDYYVTRLPS